LKRILIIEPYFGDSHRRLIEGMSKYLPFEFATITMKPRKWKWRMRGAAMYLAKELQKISQQFDCLFCSSFMSLTDLVALGPKWLRDIPKIVYFHENQLVYPVRLQKEWDFHFGMTNVITAMCADKVIFNSEFNRKSFLETIPIFLKKFPDYRPTKVVETIGAKSQVMPPPLDADEFKDLLFHDKSGSVKFLWNHRWEFDKNPESFFKVLEDLQSEGYAFRVNVLGEKFKEHPPVFDQARESLRDSIDHWGYVPERRAYLQMLAHSDVVISTALHEFFGIAVMEAVAAGCYPMLPNRLAYPYIFPRQFLYNDDYQLKKRLIWCIENKAYLRKQNFVDLVKPYFWHNWISSYNSLF